jgi:hypothetical protein
MTAPASASSQATRAITLDLEPGRFRFSVWRNVSVTIWTEKMTFQAGQRVLKLSRDLTRQMPEGRSQVMIVTANTPAPDDETTQLLGEIYDPRLSRIVCIAAVLEGQGFWASGIRSKMTNMRIAAGNAMAIRTNDSVEEVATWLPEEHAERTGVSFSANELRSMLVAVRALGTSADP